MNQRVSLKNIKFSEFMSEETNCFKSDIYFDGKKVAYCSNDGRGGSTYCTPYQGQKELFNEMLDYCNSLPDIIYQGITLKSDLELVVDELFEEFLKAKDEKKFEKNFDKGICYGTKEQYAILTFKRGGKSITIKDIMKSEDGKAHLTKTCKQLVKDGHTILNTNITY